MEFAEHRMFMDLLEPADEFFVVEKSLGRYLHVPDYGKEELLDVFGSETGEYLAVDAARE